MMDEDVSIATLLQFVFKPLDQYTLGDLESLQERLEYFIAFPEQSGEDPSTLRVADIGLQLLLDEIRDRKEL